jgi:phage terminase large subunit
VSEPKKTILIARKTLPSLRLTAYKVFIDLLKEYGYYSRCIHNKTDRTVTFQSDPLDDSTASTVYFLSIDDPEKIKSTEFNYAFLEEANEFTFDDFFIVWTRMSGATTPDQPNKLFLALNPNDEFSWINQRLHTWDDVEFIHSTFKDNPFLSEEYKKILTDLADVDVALYKIYALGEWAELPNVIYRNYITEPIDGAFNDEWYGLDFGFNHPTALVWVGRRDDGMYVKQLIYESHKTNQDIIDMLADVGVNKKLPIYADSAEPARIEEIYRAGYNIYEAQKKVDDGIDSVKRFKLHIPPESTDLLKELQTYKWRQDKNGNVLDEPVKFNDDLMDAMRYAIHTHTLDNKPDVVFPRGH